MILSTLKVLSQHKYQAIKRLNDVVLSPVFRGVPSLLSKGLNSNDEKDLINLCPVKALSINPLRLDLGKCIFCGECARHYPNNVTFSNDWRMWSYSREGLIVEADKAWSVRECEKPFGLFGDAVKLRQISSGGDGTNEMELNASGNVNFDMRRYGIEFVASPRHADGVVITGPVTANMARATEITFAAVSQPRFVVAVGSDAISGGLYAESPAIDRSFFDRHKPSLYVPGHPAHPLTFIGGMLGLMGRGF